MNDHSGLTVWFTGLPSSGKTTIASAVYQRLCSAGYRVELLDGDEVRETLCKDLGYSHIDREENLRRLSFVSELLARNGIIVLVAAISPYRKVREEIRHNASNFVEVYVNAPLSLCEHRDVKGLYRRARIGEVQNLTGIGDVYEPPVNPELECHTDLESPSASAAKVLTRILDSVRPVKRRAAGN